MRSAVEDEVTVRIEDRERAAAVGDDLIDIAIIVGITAQAGRIGNRQPANTRGALQESFVGEDGVVEIIAVIANARGLVGGEEIIAIIALVRDDVIDLAVGGGVAGDGIGLIDAEDRATCLQIDERRIARPVAVAAIERQRAEVLETQRHDAGDGCRGDIDNGDAVGFLQRDQRLGAIRGDGDVFRLEILRHGCPGRRKGRDGREQANTAGNQRRGLAVVRIEPGGLYRGGGGAA